MCLLCRERQPPSRWQTLFFGSGSSLFPCILTHCAMYFLWGLNQLCWQQGCLFRRTLPLNKCFNLTFIAICSFKRIRTETKRVSYVLCASHDISRIDPFVYLTSFKRRNNGEGEVFPILCFGSSWNTFRALRAIRLVYLVCDRRDSQLNKVFPPTTCRPWRILPWGLMDLKSVLCLAHFLPGIKLKEKAPPDRGLGG